MTLTPIDIQSIKKALQPEFDSLKLDVKKLEKKVDKGFRENHKDHNLIIKVFDERDSDLKKRVKTLENKIGFAPFKSL